MPEVTEFLEDGEPQSVTLSVNAAGSAAIFSEHDYDANVMDAFVNIGIGIKPAVFPLLKAGNLNGSPDVDLGDAILALKVLAGQEPVGIYSGADVDGDGAVGLAEAIYIMQSVAGLR